MQRRGVCERCLPRGAGIQPPGVGILVKRLPRDFILTGCFVSGGLIGDRNLLRIGLQAREVLFIGGLQRCKLGLCVRGVHRVKIFRQVRNAAAAAVASTQRTTPASSAASGVVKQLVGGVGPLDRIARFIVCNLVFPAGRGLLHRLSGEVRPLGHVRCVWVYLMGLGGLHEALLHLLFCPGACHV